MKNFKSNAGYRVDCWVYESDESDRSKITEESLYTCIGGLIADNVPLEALVIPTMFGFALIES